jgi:uncharacterized protein
MKFQPDTLAGVNQITRVEAHRVWVGGTAFEHSVVVPWVGAVQPWDAAAYDTLSAPHFDRLVALAPQVLIFGSGSRLRFARPAWLQRLYEARIGVESMDTAAAARTYNVLVNEGRTVVAALLVGGDA